MTSKSAQGKTGKYSGLVKSVQKTQEPEEPRITPEQVTEAFQSFGFTVNDRNHNDIGYWTTKGKSELPKLMEELHKRRSEIMKKEDDDKREEDDRQKQSRTMMADHEQSKATLPRLSDNDIAALFDEYGLPPPDPEWARNHLPNDPKKIRSILEMQRKTADSMLKKHAKNAVNSMPEVPKAMPGMPAPAAATPMPMGGMGGPTPLGMQGAMGMGSEPATPFFIGDHALVRITNQNNPNVSTLWLVDANKKVMRPFVSEKAFANAFDDPEEAQKAVVTMSSKELAPGGALAGFKPLQAKQGVSDDGSMEDIPFTPAQLQRRYGKPSNPGAENKALSMLDGIVGQMSGK